MPTLYLASASPRRRELLTQIGVPFRLLACSVDESVWPAESPERYVERLARAKAQAGMVLLDADADACVLGADTSVVLDGRILGKPADRDDALQMLQSLSGREHQVMTAVAVAGRQGCAASLVVSRVAFRAITPEQITQLLAGVVLDDDPKPVCAAACTLVDSHCLDLTLTAGKYHQVKRMLAAVSNRVEGLHRSKIGQWALPEDLAPGQWRWLRKEDLQLLTMAVDNPPSVG